ncbi:hypothetical protein H632_c5041p0, partial [Helicosporidium sp. ATCC 50920]
HCASTAAWTPRRTRCTWATCRCFATIWTGGPTCPSWTSCATWAATSPCLPCCSARASEAGSAAGCRTRSFRTSSCRATTSCTCTARWASAC